MKNILILDDNKDVLEAVSTRLPKYVQGCTVITASDGAQGEEILRSHAIDLVVTDLSMPVMDGFVLIERARNLYPAVPVCVMTANCSPEAINRLQSMGVGRWIEKPFKVEKLARMVAEELDLKFND